MPVIGIDVSKSKLHCVLLRADGKRKAKAFSNAPDGYASLVQWALYYGHCVFSQLPAVLEATGVYHEAGPSPARRAAEGFCPQSCPGRTFCEGAGSQD